MKNKSTLDAEKECFNCFLFAFQENALPEKSKLIQVRWDGDGEALGWLYVFRMVRNDLRTLSPGKNLNAKRGGKGH
jgi:hypothetical protein